MIPTRLSQHAREVVVYQLHCPLGHSLEIGPEHFGQRMMCPLCQAVMHASPPRAGNPPLAKYEVMCAQGHILRVKQKYLNQEIRCPSCQSLVSMKPSMLLTSSGKPLGDSIPGAFKKKAKDRQLKKKDIPRRDSSPHPSKPASVTQPAPRLSRIPPPPPQPSGDTDDELPKKPEIVEEDIPDTVPVPASLPGAPPTIYDDDDFEFEVVDTQFHMELAASGIEQPPSKITRRETKSKKIEAPPVQLQPISELHTAPTGLQSLSNSEMMKAHQAGSSSTMQFLCPNGHLLELDVQHRGAQVQCPTCQTVFVWAG